MGAGRAIGNGVERVTDATMDTRPLVQAGLGIVLLVGTPLIASQLPAGPRAVGTYIGAAGTLGGLVLLITGIARGLLGWMDADSYSDASTGQQMLVLAVGTLVVLGIPLAALIGYVALTG